MLIIYALHVFILFLFSCTCINLLTNFFLHEFSDKSLHKGCCLETNFKKLRGTKIEVNPIVQGYFYKSNTWVQPRLHRSPWIPFNHKVKKHIFFKKRKFC